MNSIDEKGRTGLSVACCRDEGWEFSLPIVKLLLGKRFAPLMTDQNGWNALHCAARYSSAQVVAVLLQKMHNNMCNNRTHNGFSALTLCCLRDDEEAVNVARVLLDAGADIECVEAEWSRTPLLVACRQGRPELVSLLLQRGANVKALGKNRRNVIQLACYNGEFGREMIPLLIRVGVDVLQQNKSGWSSVISLLLIRSVRWLSEQSLG
jgi:hypothetical protein